MNPKHSDYALGVLIGVLSVLMYFAIHWRTGFQMMGVTP
jgi:hypothetical protein